MKFSEELKWFRINNKFCTSIKERNRLQAKWIEDHSNRWKEGLGYVEHGNIGFGGARKFVYVDVNTDSKYMKDLMLNLWGLDKPSLLISVTGGAGNFKMSKRLEETFRRGLKKIALTTGAWIITGSAHAGVMEQVGEAVKDLGNASSIRPVVTIGIVPKGLESNCEMEQETNLKESEFHYDLNYSHFIRVKTAKDDDISIGISFRVNLEYEIAKIQTDDNDVLFHIVLLVLGGGIDTLKTVNAALKRETPVVIVKGSGRMADILAYAYKNAKEKNQDGNSQKRTGCMEDALKNEVKERLETEFGPSNIDEHIIKIKECLNENYLLSVFELDNTSGSCELDMSM